MQSLQSLTLQASLNGKQSKQLQSEQCLTCSLIYVQPNKQQQRRLPRILSHRIYAQPLLRFRVALSGFHALTLGTLVTGHCNLLYQYFAQEISYFCTYYSMPSYSLTAEPAPSSSLPSAARWRSNELRRSTLRSHTPRFSALGMYNLGRSLVQIHPSVLLSY